MSGKRLAAVPEAGPLRDAVYIRVSSVMGREDDRFLSPDLQVQAIDRARSVAPGPSVVVATERDIDVSGDSMVRPGLGRLLERAARGELDRIWCYDLSRWARVADEGLSELKRLEQLGCRVMSTAEQVDLGTPEGYFNATLMLAVHELRRKQIGRSWQQVHANRAGRGLWVGSTAPIGFRRARVEEGETKGLLYPSDEAGAVRQVFTRYAGGWRIHDVTRAFNAATGRGRAVVTVKRMLRNPVYVGKVTLNGQTFDGLHEGLVDVEVFEAVQARVRRDSRTPSRVLAVAHALSGLVVCGEPGCGRRMTMHPDKRPGETARMQCVRQRDNHTCTGPGSPAVGKLEQLVLSRLAGWLDDVEVDTAAAAARRAASARHQVDADRLRRELEEQKRARAKLAVSHARGVLDDDQLRDADAVLKEEVDRLGVLLAEAELDAPVVDVAPLVAAGRHLLERWDVMTVGERHRALSACVARVTVRRGEKPGEPLEGRVDVTFR